MASLTELQNRKQLYLEAEAAVLKIRKRKMQQGWIKINDEGYSQIVIEADGKKIPLRYTVSQHERWQSFNTVGRIARKFF